MGGKLGGQGLNAVAPGRLIHLVDEKTGDMFLVDTGAAFSVMPHQATTIPLGPKLHGPNGLAIPCWGERCITVSFSGHLFTWKFLLAAVDFPIIGIDFLQHYRLLVDPAAGRLRNSLGGKILTTVAACIPCRPDSPSTRPLADPSGLIAGAEDPILTEQTVSAGLIAGPSSTSSSPSRPLADPQKVTHSRISTEPPPKSLQQVLASFEDVLNADGRLPPSTHGVLHHIVTTGPPVSAKFWRLEGSKLEAAKQEFAELERDGIVRRSQSCWASPLHMVEKTDGSWRPCGDFRRLNLLTAADKYPVPNMEDLRAQLAGTTIYSKLDLKKGYHQIPVNPEDVSKTAVITPFGLFEFTRMPFGLKNAGMTFQRFMDQLFGHLGFAFVYLDDILVASKDEATHLVHLQETLKILRENGLVLNASKCQFMKKSVEYLGHEISVEGIKPLPSGVKAVAEYPQPCTVKDLQGFLGLVNFYRRFVPAAAKILLPLTDALRGGRAGSEVLTWTTGMEAAFNTAKSVVSSVALLAHPLQSAELVLVTDASESHVGAVLQQREKRRAWQPLGFFSKKLEPAQIKHSAFDRELFAVFSAIRHFRHQVEGRSFAVWTDHKPLTFAIHRVSEPWTARQQRQLSYIAEYTNQLVHVPGKENVVADALSRPPGQLSSQPPNVADGDVSAGAIPRGPLCTISALHLQPLPGMDYVAVAKAQKTCPDTCQLRANPKLKIRDVDVGTESLWCDYSTGQSRPLIPPAFQLHLFKLLHGLSHPSIRATKRLCAARAVWRGLSSDVAGWCRDCQQCQRAKLTSQPRAPILPIEVPARSSRTYTWT